MEIWSYPRVSDPITSAHIELACQADCDWTFTKALFWTNLSEVTLVWPSLVSSTFPFLRLLYTDPLFPFLDLFYKPLLCRGARGNFQVWFLLLRLCCVALFFAALVFPVLLFYTLRGSVVWFVAVLFLTIQCHLPIHIFVQLDLDMVLCVLVLAWWVFVFGSTAVGVLFCSIIVWSDAYWCSGQHFGWIFRFYCLFMQAKYILRFIIANSLM